MSADTSLSISPHAQTDATAYFGQVVCTLNGCWLYVLTSKPSNGSITHNVSNICLLTLFLPLFVMCTICQCMISELPAVRERPQMPVVGQLQMWMRTVYLQMWTDVDAQNVCPHISGPVSDFSRSISRLLSTVLRHCWLSNRTASASDSTFSQQQIVIWLRHDWITVQTEVTVKLVAENWNCMHYTITRGR